MIKMSSKYEESAGAVIFYMDNSEPVFLLLKYPTYWGFAKGLIEKKENIEETARREIEEETGFKNINIIPGFQYIQEWFYKLNGQLIKKKATFLLAEIPKEQAEKVVLSQEHEGFAWLKFEDALKKMKIKNNKEMLKKACEFIKKQTNA